MKEEIDSIVSVPLFNTEKELKQYISKAYSKIHEYELKLYEKEMYTDDEADVIKNWKRELLKSSRIAQFNIDKINKEKNLIEKNKSYCHENEHNDLEETVKMVARQVFKAEDNTVKLEKSTVKLKGLNYTSKELQEEIEKARKSINIGKDKARKEIFMVNVAFVIFIFTCILILFDKFGILDILLRFIGFK